MADPQTDAILGADFLDTLRGRIAAVLDAMDAAGARATDVRFDVDDVPIRIVPGDDIVRVDAGGDLAGNKPTFSWRLPLAWIRRDLTAT